MAVVLKKAELKVYVYTGDIENKGQPKYTLTKSKMDGDDVVIFEIAELVKDYLPVVFDGDPKTAELTAWVRTELTRTFEDNQTESESQDANALVRTYVAFRGYGELYDVNSTNASNINPDLKHKALISNRTIYKPVGEPVFIPHFKAVGEGTYKIASFNATDTKLEEFATSGNVKNVTVDTTGLLASKGTDRLYDTSVTALRMSDSGGFISGAEYSKDASKIQFIGADGSVQTINVIDVCETKFDPIKVSFINKFGVIQELWFFKRKDRSFDVTKESFQHSSLRLTRLQSGVNDQTLDFDTTVHPNKDFHIQGTKKITMNTGFVSEDHNEVIKQLLVTEYAWIHDDNGPTPVKPSNVSFQEKSGINDKVINFTLDFEYAHGYIQNIR